MGAMIFARSPAQTQKPVLYSEQSTPVGHVLVRDDFIHAPGVALIVKVGESLGTYDQTLARTRTLLAIVVFSSRRSSSVVGSFALASSAVGPIDRMNAAMREIRSDQLDRRLGLRPAPTSWDVWPRASTPCSIACKRASRASGSSSPTPRTS